MKVKNIRQLVKNELLSNTTEYELKTINDCSFNGEPKTLLRLDSENVKKVECMLKYNPDYPQFVDFKNGLSDDECVKIVYEIKEEVKGNFDKSEKDRKYKYSSTFYIFAFAIARKEKELEDKNIYECYIKTILAKINSENHTHASYEAIDEITDRICNEFTPNELLESLKEPYEKENYRECDYKLLRCIIKKTCDNHYFSLATKFCHFLNFYIFLETDYADLFSIYDSIVRDNLHYYYNYYVKGIKNNVDQPIENRKYKYNSADLKNLDDNQACDKIIEIYRDYQTIIDEIISVTGISRNGFDHLIWYNGKNS